MKKAKNIPKRATWYAPDKCWQNGPRGDGGSPKGDWTGWRPDGTVLWTAQYHPYWHGALHGTVTYFDRKGKVTRVEHYERGIRVAKPPVLETQKFVRPKLKGTPYERLMQLDAAMRAAKHEDYADVAWKKVKPSDVAAAEKKLGTKLPPSYVAFVKEHGVFDIRGTNEAVYNRLLAPLEIAKVTLALRQHGEEFLEDGLCFQGNLYDDNFYAFRVSSRRKDGEMCVGEWWHDDESGWPKRFKTFDQHIGELCANWCDELE